jgi:hypothetical protein
MRNEIWQSTSVNSRQELMFARKGLGDARHHIRTQHERCYSIATQLMRHCASLYIPCREDVRKHRRSIWFRLISASIERGSRPEGSEQDDKGKFCLTAGTLCPANHERQQAVEPDAASIGKLRLITLNPVTSFAASIEQRRYPSGLLSMSAHSPKR